MIWIFTLSSKLNFCNFYISDRIRTGFKFMLTEHIAYNKNINNFSFFRERRSVKWYVGLTLPKWWEELLVLVAQWSVSTLACSSSPVSWSSLDHSWTLRLENGPPALSPPATTSMLLAVRGHQPATNKELLNQSYIFFCLLLFFSKQSFQVADSAWRIKFRSEKILKHRKEICILLNWNISNKVDNSKCSGVETKDKNKGVFKQNWYQTQLCHNVCVCRYKSLKG